MLIMNNVNKKSPKKELNFFYDVINIFFNSMGLEKMKPYHYTYEVYGLSTLYFDFTEIISDLNIIHIIRMNNISCNIIGVNRWQIAVHLNSIIIHNIKKIKFPYEYERIGKYLCKINNGINGLEQIYFRHRLLESITNVDHLISAFNKEITPEAKKLLKNRVMKLPIKDKHLNVYREIKLGELLDD